MTVRVEWLHLAMGTIAPTGINAMDAGPVHDQERGILHNNGVITLHWVLKINDLRAHLTL